MKKFLFVLGIVVLLGGIFVGGLILGTRLDFMNAMFQVSTVDKALVEATTTFLHVSQLEKGKTDEATSFLNQELNSHIITMGQFLTDCPNDQTRQHVRKLLARIAKHRQEHPAQINVTNQVPGYAAVERRVQEILNEALQEEKKQNQPSDRTR